ncbi:MAG: RNA 2',3'-cyclic phosphodiesterase [Dehalococcoidia bacterium]|nr:RNA 2',3'-cyclic phosphodiesterase [Dehalococcoidia bacterium]
MIRAFVAVDISQEARRTLAEAVDSLHGRGISGVRWVRPSAIHLTLKFLGEVDASLTPGIMDALGRAASGRPPFRLGLSGLGAFPRPEAPRTIWAGLEGDLGELEGLQRDVDREVSPAAGVPAEKRPFLPHLTLGRVRDRVSSAQRRSIADALRRAALAQPPPWTVARLHLVRSNLTPGGAVYDILGTCDMAVE